MNEMGIQPHNVKSAATWNSGGDLYDEISRGIADSIAHAVFRLAPKPGEKVLDLATGTGWTSRSVVASGAHVVGLDLGADLIEAARAKAERDALAIEYVVGDAEQLPFPDHSFDAVISTCGIMFASRPEVAAAELARVCKPGGRMALTAWTPESNLFKMFLIMKSFMASPPVPPPPSPFEWGKPARLKELLGTEFDLSFEHATSFYREPSALRAWEVFSEGYGPVKSLAANLDPDRLEAFQKAFIDFHAQFATDLGICVPRDYVLAVGVRV